MAERSITFWYGRAEDGYESRYPLTVRGAYDLSDAWDQSMLMKHAAQDYHSNHDGWEASWPCTFALAASEDGPEVARFTIDRDVEPVFYVKRDPGVDVPAVIDRALLELAAKNGNAAAVDKLAAGVMVLGEGQPVAYRVRFKHQSNPPGAWRYFAFDPATFNPAAMRKDEEFQFLGEVPSPYGVDVPVAPLPYSLWPKLATDAYEALERHLASGPSFPLGLLIQLRAGIAGRAVEFPAGVSGTDGKGVAPAASAGFSGISGDES